MVSVEGKNGSDSSLTGSIHSVVKIVDSQGKEKDASSTKIVMIKNLKCIFLEKNNFFGWQAQFDTSTPSFEVTSS